MAELQVGGKTLVTQTGTDNPVLGSTVNINNTLQNSIVAQNSGPAFSVYISDSQVVSSGEFAKLILDGEIFNVDNAFDTTNNYIFQPSVAGYYLVGGTLRYGGDTNTRVMFLIYKNNSAYMRIEDSGGSFNTTIDGNVAGSTLVHMNGTTDYLDFRGYVSGTGTSFFNYYSNGTGTNCWGVLMRAE